MTLLTTFPPRVLACLCVALVILGIAAYMILFADWHESNESDPNIFTE